MKKNWITTLVGQALGLISGFIAIQADGGTISFKAFLAYLVPALLGLVSKDFNTTGTGNNASK